MPTPNIDDRKEIARLAVARGWSVTEVRQHTTPNAEQKANKVLFEVHYVNRDAGIVVMYNAIDKMTSAHMQIAGKHQTHAYRKATLRQWLEAYGDEEVDVRYTANTAEVLRNKEIVATAVRDDEGYWRITVPQNIFDEDGSPRYGTVVIGGFTEAQNRKLLLATLKGLA